MEEQQTGMATPSAEPSTATKPTTNDAKPAVKLNRRQKRHVKALRRREQSKVAGVSQRRLNNYNTLSKWREKSELPADQKDLVFKLALAKLFKKDFKKEGEFEQKLKSITKNVLAAAKQDQSTIEV